MAETKPKKLPGLDVLGMSYDATKEYAKATSTKLRIFDLGKEYEEKTGADNVAYLYPSSLSVDPVDLNHATYVYTKAESFEEYKKELTQRVSLDAEYNLFSAHVSKSFTQAEMASLNREFVTMHHRFDSWVVNFNDYYGSLTITDSAKANINGTVVGTKKAMTAKKVMEAYGTHVIIKAVIGGRAEYSCLVDKSRHTSSSAIESAVEASYKGFFSATAKLDTRSKEERESSEGLTKTRHEIVGGTFKGENDFDPSNFSKCMKAFQERPVLVDFTADSLIPIYELADDEARQTELKTAYEEYVRNSQKELPDNVPALEVEIISENDIDFIHEKWGLWIRRPKRADEWYFVGHTGNINNKLIRIKGLVPGAVMPARTFAQAWRDEGRGSGNDYSLWNISPVAHYRPLGSIARFYVEGYGQPSGDEVKDLVLVHSSLCTEGKINDTKTWNDEGTGASQNGSVWLILPKDENGINAQTFYCQREYSRPEAKVFVIQRGPRVKVTDNT